MPNILKIIYTSKIILCLNVWNSHEHTLLSPEWLIHHPTGPFSREKKLDHLKNKPSQVHLIKGLTGMSFLSELAIWLWWKCFIPDSQ